MRTAEPAPTPVREPERVVERQPEPEPVEVAVAEPKKEKVAKVKVSKRKAAPREETETAVAAAAESGDSDSSPIQVEIYFNLGSASIGSESELASVVEWLNANPNGRIAVEGHSDPSGSPAFNLRLSRRRAQAVKQYLVSQGGSAGQIRVIAKGETDLAYSDDDAKNRRALIKNR